MPEIKNNFTGGKMNKDLDERIISNGQYRHAMNIQVSTSEGSDVGALQNILGNSKISSGFSFPSGATCVGSISDEKNDILYWFITSVTGDYILRYSDANSIEIVFADIKKDCLMFTEKIITGINVIDDMLLWTDNENEPRKINIQRSLNGTTQSGLVHTKLVNEDLGISLSGIIIDIEEKHITVIKKSPQNPLNLETFTGRDTFSTYNGIMTIVPDPGYATNNSSFIADYNSLYDFSSLQVGETFQVLMETNITGSASFTLQWNIGDKVVLKEFDDSGSPPPLPINDYRIRGVITSWIDTYSSNPCDVPGVNGTDNATSGQECNRFTADSNAAGYNPTALWPTNFPGTAHVQIQITAIEGNPPSIGGNNTLNYAIDLFDETEKLFEFRFPRFSYRYKYEDGEYSCFAPWSEVVFIPGSYDHHPKKGFNLGMTNRLTSVNVQNFVPSDIPDDVVEVDILYKEDASPNVYTVETVRPKDNILQGQATNNWQNNSYSITSETIHAVVPSNQILRPWDNVPKKALAQDITGNRVVYANYWQNYDLKAGTSTNNYYPDFRHVIEQFQTVPTNAMKSVKSLREYQLGVVFIDGYGRETPVITSPTGTFKLDKSYAKSHNRIKVGFNGIDFPHNMSYMKFYIKETSGEYYNMAMDRYYDAEDGNVWLAFPSSDRNKVDIDTFLILKKATDSNEVILEPARFKILAIENFAPDYVKTNKILIEDRQHAIGGAGLADIFGTSMTNVPSVGGDYFEMNYEPFFMSSGANMHNITDGKLYVEFSVSEQDEVSARYRITEIVCNYDSDLSNLSSAKYNVAIDGVFGDDVNFISDDTSGLNSTKIQDGAQVRIYKYAVENKPQFDGRFFVKILNDDIFRKYIKKMFRDDDADYKVVAAQKVSYLTNDFHDGGGASPANPLLSVFDLPNVTQATGWPGWNTSYMVGNQARYNFYAPSKHHFQAYLQDFKFADDGGINQTYTNAFSGGLLNVQDMLESHEEYGWWMYYPGYHPQVQTGENLNIDAPKTNWFVDNGAYHATRYDTNFKSEPDSGPSGFGYTGFDTPFGAGTYGNKGELTGLGNGIADNPGNNYWKMDLSFGGIWSRDWNWNDDTGLEYYDDMENFWVIGQTGGNEKHVDEGAFAGQLLPGTKVRWREDPEKTIYTISSGVAEKQRIRYFSYSGNQSPIGYNSNNPPPWGLINLGSWTGILDSPDGWPQGGYHQNIGFTNPANFTKTWDLKFEPSLHWNPVESGIITNGHHITLQTRSGTASDISNFATGGTANPNNAYFKFDSVVGPCSVTGTDQQIAPGMMITSYNNTPVTWPTVEPNVSAANSIAFAGGGPIVKKIEYQQASGVYHVWLTGYKKILEASDLTFSTAIQNAQNIVFRQPGMNTYNETFIENYHWMDPNLSADDRRVESVGYTLEIIEAVNPLEVLPDDPAIWETEPKETTDLNIYYEASSAIPLLLNRETIATAIPIGSKILGSGSGYVGLLWLSTDGSTVNITSATDLTLDPTEIVVNNASEIFNIGAVGAASSDPLDVNDWLALNPQQVKITTPSGLEFITNIIACDVDDITITIDDTMPFYSNDFSLTWHNCFSFGNGVESNRIRDNFNLPYILNGVKASTTFAEQYKEEHRKYGLIYSGIYNSTSGVNNLNQFIQAERITKDINPVYGSIQKLHTRDTDLVTLCEDKVLKILANKDALFNADGNTQLTATANVLGQTIPFVGEYGISKNPESFASEAYRAYFTDKVRGAVMRLSMDGLTPISSHGMKNWFKDNLRLGDKIIGSYDDKKGEYNITIN